MIEEEDDYKAYKIIFFKEICWKKYKKEHLRAIINPFVYTYRFFLGYLQEFLYLLNLRDNFIRVIFFHDQMTFHKNHVISWINEIV